MEDIKGINITDLNRISKNFIEYRREIGKIFSEYKRVIDASSSYFMGDVGTEYRKRFTEFYNKLGIILESLTVYSDSINTITNSYQTTINKINKDFGKNSIDKIK